MFNKIKNLFKLYELLTRSGLYIDLDRFCMEKDKWYHISVFAKRTKEGHYVDEITIFQFKTKKTAKKKANKLMDYYKLG